MNSPKTCPIFVRWWWSVLFASSSGLDPCDCRRFLLRDLTFSLMRETLSHTIPPWSQIELSEYSILHAVTTSRGANRETFTPQGESHFSLNAPVRRFFQSCQNSYSISLFIFPCPSNLDFHFIFNSRMMRLTISSFVRVIFVVSFVLSEI